MFGSSVYSPPVGFHFGVQLVDPLAGGITIASEFGVTPNIDGSFQEVTGISASLGVEDVEEGGENRFIHKLPKKVTFDNLVLKRGLVTVESAFNNWCNSTFAVDFSKKNKITPKNIVLLLLDESRVPLVVWVFYGAYPVKWNISQGFNAQENQVVVEEIELTYNRFEKVNTGMGYFS